MRPSGETLPKSQTLPLTRTLKLYSPHGAQKRFHDLNTRFRVAAWGRQTGKSTASINDLVRFAWRHPGAKLWYLAPTYDQAKVIYRRMVGMLWPCREVLLKKNQTELRAKLINNSEIVCKSGEVLDNLRGDSLHGAVIDEVREQPKELWSMVVRPMLSKHRGWASFVSTPNGFDSFFDLADRAKLDTSGEWSFMHLPATECPTLWRPEEIESVRREMTEAEFAQEILAEFRDVHKGKTYTFSSQNIRDESPFANGQMTADLVPLLSCYLPIVVALDFNVSPMAWTLGQNKADKFYWYDEIWLKNTNSFECADLLVEKILHAKACGLKADPQVILAGDSAGESRSTKSVGQTDYDIISQKLREANISFVNMTPSSNPMVKDRVNSTNAKLMSASGEVSMWFHPTRAKNAVKDFQRVSWKEGATGAILDKLSDSDLTHSSDGIGCAICALSPIRLDGQVGGLRVIRRW